MQLAFKIRDMYCAKSSQVMPLFFFPKKKLKTDICILFFQKRRGYRPADHFVIFSVMLKTAYAIVQGCMKMTKLRNVKTIENYSWSTLIKFSVSTFDPLL